MEKTNMVVNILFLPNLFNFSLFLLLKLVPFQTYIYMCIVCIVQERKKTTKRKKGAKAQTTKTSKTWSLYL